MRRGVAAAVCAAVGLLCLTSSALATFPGQNGDIVFTSTRDGNREIYTMHPDGTGVTNLTKQPATDDWPSASPFPSPDIEFASDRLGGFDIFYMNTFGVVSGGSSTLGDDIQPAVGDMCRAFVTNRDGNNEIYLPCSDAPNVTNNPASDTAPAWIPGAPALVFVSDRDGNSELYRLSWDVWQDLTGGFPGTLTRLTTNPAADAAPSVSPDGSKIAFETNRDGNFEVYVMNADGTGATDLSNNPASDRQPVWSPDGTKIAFQSNRDGNFEIYTMNADGSGQMRLTNSAGPDVNPEWAPRYFSGNVRPKGASPMRVSLVPAYTPCTNPNRTHGAPLSDGSCNPPQQKSGFLTIGSPDANGAPASSIASVIFRVKVTSPEDVLINASITDIRCLPATSPSVCANANAADGPDYSGALQVNVVVRRTDRYDGSTANDNSTLVDLPFSLPASCSNTSPFVGAACSVSTTANAVTPGIVMDTKRSMWQLGPVEVYDTGADGSASTTGDNTLFMTQGVYVP